MGSLQTLPQTLLLPFKEGSLKVAKPRGAQAPANQPPAPLPSSGLPEQLWGSP